MFRFTLNDNNTGSRQFDSSNVPNWADIQISLVRSASYKGRVRKLTNVFSFIGDIARMIYSNADKNSVSAEANLTIEVGNDNKEEFSYVTIGSGFPMVADFSTLKRKELEAEITFVDSSFQQKLTAGEGESINFNTSTTLDGQPVTDYKTRLKTIKMPDRVLNLNSETKLLDIEKTNAGFRNFYRGLNSEVVYKSDDSVGATYADRDTQQDIPTSYFYLNAESDRVLNVDYDIKYTVNGDNNYNDVFIIKLRRQVVDENKNPVGDELEMSSTVIEKYTETFSFEMSYSGSESIELKEGYSVRLIIWTYSGSGASQIEFLTDDDKGLTMEEVVSYPLTVSNCILPHEYFTHMIEIITGRKDAFYSNFFGRKDLGYDKDGEGAYWSLADGFMIRNVPFDKNPFNSKFKEILTDFINLGHLMAAVEYIGNTEVLRIEDFDTSFGVGSEIIDLGTLIDDFEISVDKKLTFGSVKCGYKNLSLEDLNGLNATHGELNYSTPLTSSENILDILMKTLTGEGYAIESQRRKQYSEFPDEDVKFDKNIFIVTSKMISGTYDLLALTNEGYESISGVPSPNSSYNLDITPARIIRRHSRTLAASLTHLTEGEYILTKSANSNQLVSKKDGEESINEGANIDITTFSKPIMLNDTVTIGDAPLSMAQWNILEENPNKIIKFINKDIDFYFYNDLANFKPSDLKVSFKGTMANR